LTGRTGSFFINFLTIKRELVTTYQLPS